MEPWLGDVIEQLAVAQILSKARFDAGKRLAFILIDNAIEFMMKAYGDTRLVDQVLANPPDTALAGKKLHKGRWEDVKNKRDFNLIMDWVLPNSPTSITSNKINPYHDTRNTLYHKALPLTVDPTKVSEYLNISKQLYSDLFGVTFKENEWKARIASVRNALLGEETFKPVFFSRTDGLVRVESAIPLQNTQAIMLAMYGFSRQAGRTPTLDELRKVLNYSGYSVEQLSSQIKQLRNQSLVMKTSYGLTPKGRKHLIKKFSLA